MNRIFLLLSVAALLLSGCSSSYHKDLVSNRLYHDGMSAKLLEHSPELLYCFAKDKTVLAEELAEVSVTCLAEITEAMPEEVNPQEIDIYGALFEQCSRSGYLNRNSTYLDTSFLFGEKRSKCLELKSDPAFALNLHGRKSPI